MLTGSLVAIVTPMQDGGALDLPAFRRLIDFHVANGTSGIVAVGTTGESPTVDFDEHCLLIKTAVEHAAGRIPVMAGTGAAFSLFPPENASGNYVKIVQRIPVKIVLDPNQGAEEVLRVGMSVNPTILAEE